MSRSLSAKVLAATIVATSLGGAPAHANPPGTGTAPGYSTILQVVYSTFPNTTTYGRVWVDGAFGASGIGAFDVNVDIDGNGTKEPVLGFCIEYSNGSHPPQNGTWLSDPAAWGQDPPGAPAPAHAPTQKDLVKVSYVLWKYGQRGASNDQAAAVAYLVHFYGQDRSASSSGYSVLVPDVNNNDRLDEVIAIKRDTRTGADTNIDELMRKYDAEAEAWGAAFNFLVANVNGGIVATPAGAVAKTTGKPLPANSFVTTGAWRTTAAMAKPLSAGANQSILAAGLPQRAAYATPVITSRAQSPLVVAVSPTLPKISDTIIVTGATPNGKGLLVARVFNRTTRQMTSIVSGPVAVTFSATGTLTYTMPAVAVPPGKYEFVEGIVDFGFDQKPNTNDDYLYTRDPLTSPAIPEQFETRVMKVETQSQTNVIPVPTNAVTAANIAIGATGTASLVSVGTASASPIKTIVDRVKVTGATPGGQVTGSLLAYPLVNGVRDCTRPSATVTYSGTADATGTLVILAPGIQVSALVSTKWEFIENAKDVTTGISAGRRCDVGPVVLLETSTITAPVNGAISRTSNNVQYDPVTMRATATDYVAVFGGYANQSVTVTVSAIPIVAATNKRDCAKTTAPVRATAKLGPNGVALVKMPPITIDVSIALTWEFVESVDFGGGRIVGRTCATSPRVAAETISFTRGVDVNLWDTGVDADVPVAPRVAAVPLPPQIGSLKMPRLSTATTPIYTLPASAPSSALTTGLYHRGGSEPLCSAGNPVVAGHRTTSGGVLRNIQTFQVGDLITVTPAGKAACTYRVHAKVIVAKTDANWLKVLVGPRPLPGFDKTLTLFTCTDLAGTGTSTAYRYLVILTKV